MDIVILNYKFFIFLVLLLVIVVRMPREIKSVVDYAEELCRLERSIYGIMARLITTEEYKEPRYILGYFQRELEYLHREFPYFVTDEVLKKGEECEDILCYINLLGSIVESVRSTMIELYGRTGYVPAKGTELPIEVKPVIGVSDKFVNLVNDIGISMLKVLNTFMDLIDLNINRLVSEESYTKIERGEKEGIKFPKQWHLEGNFYDIIFYEEPVHAVVEFGLKPEHGGKQYSVDVYYLSCSEHGEDSYCEHTLALLMYADIMRSVQEFQVALMVSPETVSKSVHVKAGV